MSDIYQTIESALDATLQSITGIPSIAFENVEFDKDADSTFIEPVFIPTERIPAVRGINPQVRYQGLYRVEINTPRGIGKGSANVIASKIISAFKETTSISYGGKFISLRYVEKEVGAANGAFWTLPVNVGWYIYE